MKSVADRKKTQNIGEYLIYMYQMEDLIRSYQGNIGELRQYVVAHYPVSEEEKTEIIAWFESILETMKSQEILEKGHLKELKDLVDNLANLHWKLLKTDKTYFDSYTKAKPFILDAIVDANGENPGNEIQICLNGIYGLLLNRLLGGTVEDKRVAAAEAFGEVLGLLNFHYQQRIFLSPN
jgi:Tfp pilus assembly ATPase PilU